MTARRRSGLERFRRFLYFTQRDIGDYQALQRGHGALERRIVRRSATRSLFQSFRRMNRIK